ncbi:mitochondrial ribosome-associated GTPase 1-like [Physella acuta]|uniref:mitochondrial ribosome-associated GTPase 1-like n=1 Tax=Physella acuta TaxID=109671 RepID=UPI0027DBA52D|nr:mitochondrial ribosome-associated GTPase 1-like [Physella acuta]
MSRKFFEIQKTFRRSFELPGKNIKWFPGHMMKGLLQIQAKLQKVDCIIEIHDARIPISGRNNRFRDVIKLRPHILLLNKVDLTPLNTEKDTKEKIVKKLHEQGVDSIFFTNFKNTAHEQFLKKTILPVAHELIESRPRYSREGQEDYNLLVIGVPNVGKSTFINSLRSTLMLKKGRATSVGSIPGITRSVLSKIKVSTNPNVYIIDTPGILSPRIGGLEEGMKLAACSCIPDHLVGEVDVADYVLYWLNKNEHFQYIDHFELEEPTDNILNLLSKIAIKHKLILRVKDVATNQFVYRPDNTQASFLFLSAFREGKLGSFILDNIG